MRQIKSIHIPQPCKETWQQMMPDGDGRYCAHCCKTVTDFTVMDNSRIIAYLATENNVCGRFNDVQINQLNDQFKLADKPAISWKKISLAAVLLVAMPFVKIKAKAVYRTEQAPFNSKQPAVVDTLLKTISGKIIEDSTNVAVVGANITLAGTDIYAVTDINGEYQITVPVNADSLKVSFIGYETAYLKVDLTNTVQSTVMLKPGLQSFVTVFTGGIIVRRPFFSRVWYNVKHVFTGR